MRLLGDEYMHDGKICLDFEIYARAFVKLAAKTTEPLTFGIFGEWGTGKTTLMRTINKIFDDEFIGKVYSVWFNPWEYPPEENMVKAILQTMIIQEWYPKLSKGKKTILPILEMLSKLLSSAIPGVPDLKDFGEYIKKMCSQQELEPSSFMSLRKTFEKFISHLTTEENGERSLLVFFIDDLDRCLPQKIVGMLENIRLIFNFRNCIFFVGADRQVVADGINFFYRKDYGAEGKHIDFDGERYLEKMIQVPFFIPLNNPEKIGNYFDSFNIENNNTLCKILQEVELNPRKIKRIINSIILSWTTFNVKTDNPENSLDLTVLAILKVIELKWKVFFRSLVHVVNEGHVSTFMQNIKTLCEKTFSMVGRKEKQREELVEIYEKHNLYFEGNNEDNFFNFADQRFFTFFNNSIVKDNLFKPEVLNNLRNYINSTRGFSSEIESFSHEITTSSLIEQALEFLKAEKIDEFNSLRKKSDYSTLNFSGKKFYKIGHSFEYADFSNCRLMEADFQGCQLKNANFENTNLQGANFFNADCTNVIFTNTMMEMANLKKAQLAGTNFKNSKLRGSNWWEALDSDKVLSNVIMTKFRKPETKMEIENWRTEFKFYHYFADEEICPN